MYKKTSPPPTIFRLLTEALFFKKKCCMLVFSARVFWIWALRALKVCSRDFDETIYCHQFFCFPLRHVDILDFPFWAFCFFAWFHSNSFDHTSDKHLTKEFFLFSRRFRSEIDSEKGNKRKGRKEIMEITSTKRAVFIFYVVNWILKLLSQSLETTFGDIRSSILNRCINFCYFDPLHYEVNNKLKILGSGWTKDKDKNSK